MSSIPFSREDSESGSRLQAEPLPSKRGEIGYVEGVHNLHQGREGMASTDGIPLPERHPADRDHNPPPAEPANPPSTSQNAQPSPSTTTKSFSFLKPRKSFGGVQLSTLLIFTAQVSLLGGTVAAWVFATEVLRRMGKKGQGLPGGQYSAVFVHVVFIIAVIGQLVFLERRLFRLRGERYSHIHPGEVLPRHRTIPVHPDTAIAFAPWNRPPLPTYAAALTQSGLGTGDVEDHLIAAPPPPAYGNTRGSTLLLAGHLRESLRAQRPLSATSQGPAPTLTTTGRPLSYVSRDDQWEEIQDADRARRLEETLNRLESARPPHSPETRSQGP
ncbi:hypothetical protein M413DRAFT_444098 [Hebeloma cylindrosporum]|uniref:Uncharacterized protein n=1 Tax=Hebeloma cylindrosporum TaxID=76867 RepID=A0A0C2Y099_HEBCY|nr:hypothetical protein M413DRAFT_444098 [Hebeloma cylindrosporum h7]